MIRNSRVREKKGMRWVAGMGLCWSLQACTLGPDAKHLTSHVDLGSGYHQPEQAVGVDWNKEASQAWWHDFSSAVLDRRIQAALHNNADLQAQTLALRAQEELYQSSRGSLLFPAVNAEAKATREKVFFGPNLMFGPFTLYNAGINISYNVDLFGAARQTLRAAWAEVDAQRFQNDATRQTLVANLLTASILAAYDRAAYQISAALVVVQQQQLALTQSQWQAGAVSSDLLDRQQSALDDAQAALPSFEKGSQQAQHQINTLMGQSPQEPLESLDLSSVALPAAIPVSLPSRLLQRRPDVRAAESLWRAAAARVGVAEAQLWPQLNITASLLGEAVTPSQLFRSKSLVWGLGAGLTQPLFNGGALRAQKKAAQAEFDEAGYRYRQTAVLAFQGVADAMSALQQDQRTEQLRASALQAQQRRLAQAQVRYRAGSLAWSDVLDVQLAQLQAQMAWTTAHATSLTDAVALYQVLGGAWVTDQVNAATKGGKSS